MANSLKEFQAYGSAKGLKENNEVAYNTLVDEIHKYNKELVNFFMFGVNSPLVNNPIQVADIILYTKNLRLFQGICMLMNILRNIHLKDSLELRLNGHILVKNEVKKYKSKVLRIIKNSSSNMICYFLIKGILSFYQRQL